MGEIIAQGIPEVSQSKPAYWAVIPSDVRYDDRIRPNGKILYAEVTALASRDGYSWADNQYFAEVFGWSIRAVQQLLKQLDELGYIKIEIVKKGNQQSKEARKIWVSRAVFETISSRKNIRQLGELAHKNSELAHKNSELAHKNSPLLQINNNNNITIGRNVCESDFKRERFEGFWRFYKAVTPKGTSVGGKDRALKAWNKLSPDDATIAAMGAALKAQSTAADWMRGIGIPNASTWLNQRRWEDSPEFGEAGANQAPERGVQQW